MAKYGEGDKRWIVEERPDGTNPQLAVWHWAETDCLEWSRSFFSKRLANVPILDGERKLSIRIKKVDKVEGEAYVNVRKGKIIPGYELNVVIIWEGEARYSDGKTLLKAEGVVEIPYISDENADEDPGMRFRVKDDGPIGKRLKEAIVTRGKALIVGKVKEFVTTMARGGRTKDELEAKKVAPKSNIGNTNKQALTAAAAAVSKEKEPKKTLKEGFGTITLTDRFSCKARDIYKIMMDENKWKGFTRSRIRKEVGRQFCIFDGLVTGTNLELQDGKFIVQKWRFGSWPDGVESTVKLILDEPEPEPEVTVVKLTHTDVPVEDLDLLLVPLTLR